ncbi:MAG: hypothetical protein ABSE35_10925 [Bryobacteraceae bacterium]|jgi:hypothetical protein
MTPLWRFLTLALFWFYTFYALANAAFALWNPSGWIRARWTAKRSFHPERNPLSNGDIRAYGGLFSFLAILGAVLAIKLTLALLR